MTDRRVADLEQRRAAIQPDGSFLVQAPAGSGKTELLIQRYLRLLAVVDEPEEIVAITFTRKAAGEMRGRILNALERVDTAAAPADEAARQTLALAAAAMTRNRERGWQLEHSPGRLRIQTIDSLCGALTRQMPVLSRFGSQPEIVEEPGELYRRAAADTLAELEAGAGWSEAIAVLLGHLDNDLPRVRDMLAEMLARRDQWLRHVAGDIHRDVLEAALRHVITTTLVAVQRAFPPDCGNELAALLDFAAVNLDRGGREAPAGACRGLIDLPPAEAAALGQWRGIAGLLLKSDGEWRQAPTARDGFPAAGGGKAEAETCRAMKDRFKGLIARLREEEGLQLRLQAVRRLPPAAYTDAEWQVVLALCELLKLADAQLRLLYSERNQIDFTGVAQAAVQALGGEDNPTDLALGLDYRIRHILVDEFQDISINQYTLLQRLTAGWSSGDGHSLFLVGDPMQSIYRFREAEVGLYLNTLEQRRLGQAPVTPLNITVNFRSRAGIVEWVNRTFARVLPASPDAGRGAVSYTPAEAFQDQPPGGAVTLYPLIGRDDEREAEIVLTQIRAARENDPDGTIAVLVRSRPHLQAVVPRLKQAGLRFRAVEIEPLGTQPPIQDLMALTRALHHFADRIAWLAILRAPWCGLCLSDLLQLAGAKGVSVWEALQDRDRLAALSEEGKRRAAALRETLAVAFERRQRLSLSRWVESAWLRLGGPATLRDETDLENSRAFFDLLDRFDEGGDLRDRDGFLEEVQKLHAAPDVGADETLQIMTIHKAKGLEFDTVILPGLGRGRRNDENRLLRWAEIPHRDHQDLLLAPVQAAGDVDSPVYDFIKGLDREKQAYEDARLLYVAATRARRRLHLIAAAEIRRRNGMPQACAPRPDSLLARLWPAVEGQFRQAFDEAQDDEEGEAQTPPATPGPGLRRLASGWRLPPAPAAVAWRPEAVVPEGGAAEAVEFDWAGETIRHLGTVVHRCIQRLAEDGIAAWDAERIRAGTDYYRRALQRLGVPEGDLDWASRRVAEALENMIDDEKGRWLLGSHREAENEYAVSGLYEGSLVNIVIDRTFVDDRDNRWIIDYKTSSHEGGATEEFLDREQARYRDQMRTYAAVLANLDGRPIRLALYFPLLRGWREWGPGE